MLGCATADTGTPEAERAGLELPAHEADDSRLVQPVQRFYGLEGRAILPGHLNDAGQLRGG